MSEMPTRFARDASRGEDGRGRKSAQSADKPRPFPALKTFVGLTFRFVGLTLKFLGLTFKFVGLISKFVGLIPKFVGLTPHPQMTQIGQI